MTDAITEASPRPGLPTGELAELVQTLWPAPVTWSLGRAGGGQGTRLLGDLTVLPSADSPRTLLPRRPALASAVTMASAAAHSNLARVRARAVSVAMQAGASPLLGTRLRLWSTDPDGADTIERALSSLLGEPVTVSVRLGPPRANRKPVLHVLSRAAEVIAIAKIGVTGLSRALVLAESAALRDLGGRSWTTVTVPRLIHSGQWRDTALLVQSPLLAAKPRKLSATRRIAAMREVAVSAGVHRGSLAGSVYIDALAARIEALADQALAARVAAQLSRLAQGSVQFGTWHGDWTEWNSAAGHDTVLLWDWERLDAPVPLGFDAVHHAVQPALVRGGGPTEADALDLIARGPTLLAPFGVSPTEAATVVGLYLLELGTRYATDGQLTSGVPAGRVSAWILPALERHAPDRLEERP
jgi:hypothetical protein